MKVSRQYGRMPMLFAVVCALVLALGACSKSAGPTVAAGAAVGVKSIELGSAVNADTRQVTAPATTFAPADTIYATVTTTGPGLDGDEVRMDADWVDQGGQVVFHSGHKGLAGASLPALLSASKPEGFKPGKYTLQIKLNGAPAASKEFTVREPD